MHLHVVPLYFLKNLIVIIYNYNPIKLQCLKPSPKPVTASTAANANLVRVFQNSVYVQ